MFGICLVGFVQGNTSILDEYSTAQGRNVQLITSVYM